jgi:hypothetical protein
MLSIALTSFATGYAADGCSGVNFKAAREYSLGQYPYALAAGDFNNDGKADVAATDYYGQSVRIAFGDGAGSFASSINFPLGTKPIFIVAGDLNNDGQLDLVTSNFEPNYLSVLLNDGAGGFSITGYSAGLPGPAGLTLGDFNGDTKLDVAVTNPASSIILIFLNDGAGGLLVPGSISLVSTTLPNSVATADFNGDGKLDLATANNSSSTTVLLGTGPGTFGAPTTIAIPNFFDPKVIAVGDLSGDGIPDLVLGSFSFRRVSVLTGNGVGGFTPQATFTIATNLVDLKLRDINDDGKLDIVVVGTVLNPFQHPPPDDINPTVTILYGNRMNTISTAQDVVMVGFAAHSLAIGDLNGDGKLDIVSNYGTPYGAGLTISLNDGAGKIEAADRAVTLSFLAEDINSPLILDWNVDGRPDLVTADNRGVSLRLSLSNGEFGEPQRGGLFDTVQIVAGDFNEDGRPDLAAADSISHTIDILRNNGVGGFENPFTYSTPGPTDALVTGDFNGDGHLDLIVTSSFLHVMRLFIGNGTGVFLLISNFNLNGNPAAIVAGDFNNDGKLDVVTANECLAASCTTKLITLSIGDGMGGFAPQVDLFNFVAYPGVTPQFLSVADFNGDGKLDLAFPKGINDSAASPQIAFNTGGGSFAPPMPLATTSNVSVLTAGDVNGDGWPDIVTGRGDNNTEIQIILNRGGVSFDPPVNYTGVIHLNGLAVGDLNVDGKRDIVFTSPMGGWRMVNKCSRLRGKAITDFDGDGITDLSVFRPSTGYWYIIYGSDNSFHAIPFGTSEDIPVPGDYDGDGKTDVAVFRPSTGDWYYLRSSDGAATFQHFGSDEDIPVQGDYDGDGKTNFAIFRPSTGTWYTSLDPATNAGAVQWGFAADIPVPADYDGDGRTDIAVFRPSSGYWYLLQSTQGYREQQFGAPTDTPVPADYDGDGKDDIAIFRPSPGRWYTSLNPATNFGEIVLGQSGDVPVPGYYDVDGRVDAAVFRNGDWQIFQTTYHSVSGVHFGSSGDVPAPAIP